MTSATLHIYGRKPVLEALKADAPLAKIYLQFGSKGGAIDDIRRLCRKKNIAVTELNAGKMQAMLPGADTQGVIAHRSTYRTSTLDELITALPKDAPPLLAALDSIQDPHNVGAILRTCEAAGVNGVLITKHNSAPLNETVMKTSAGALEMLKIALVDNLAHAFETLKKHGLWIAGTSLEADKAYHTLDFSMPLVLVFGNEEKGMRPIVQKQCDFVLKIPMAGKINSLNVSVSAGVVLFEALRQRNLGKNVNNT